MRRQVLGRLVRRVDVPILGGRTGVGVHDTAERVFGVGTQDALDQGPPRQLALVDFERLRCYRQVPASGRTLYEFVKAGRAANADLPIAECLHDGFDPLERNLEDPSDPVRAQPVGHHDESIRHQSTGELVGFGRGRDTVHRIHVSLRCLEGFSRLPRII